MHLFARRYPFALPEDAARLRFSGLDDARTPTWHRLDDRWSPRDIEAMTATIADVADRDGLDVLHFHYGVPFAEIAWRVKERLGSRAPHVVGTLHGTDVSTHGADPRTGPRLRGFLDACDELTTVSRAHAILSRAVLGLDEAPTVVSNFIDLERFRPRSDAAAPRRPRLVHVSNFRAVKDPQAVARIFVGVRQVLDAELWLVGDGDEMRATRRVLRRAGVHRDVRLLGIRRDIERILPDTDLLVVTSRSESFCLAALEAAASGVPVLATRVGGLPEVVADGETGALFDPGDIDTAVHAACRLLRDDVLRSAMGRTALERASRFSTDRVVPRYEALYARLIDGCELSPVGSGASLPSQGLR